jgi:hypothetical protein
VFSSTLPGLSRLLTQLKMPQNSLFTEENLEYKLLPLPPKEQTNDSGKIYPRLSLRFLTNQNGTTRFRGLGAFLGEHITDAIIPDLATDIRFKKRQMVWLYYATTDNNVRAYLDAIEKNVQGGDRLTAPRVLKLKIPTWTIRDPKTTVQDEWKKKDFIEMNYLFAGIEHRQIMRMGFQGHSLTYTAVQAGQLGGKRGELELRYSRSDTVEEKSGAKGQTDVLSRFVKSAFKLADLINDSALNRLSMTELGILRKIQAAQHISRTTFRKIDLSSVTGSKSQNTTKPISKDGGEVFSIEADPGSTEDMSTLPNPNSAKREDDDSGDVQKASTENNASTAEIATTNDDSVVIEDAENVVDVANDPFPRDFVPDASSNGEMESTKEARKHLTKFKSST